ncbi:sensor histidine kinase [Nocardioides jejuensis]|uniref:histidine kinase n=1 Tax=Nocardioides jejuensis TaxID=2502782 RepID=A0A4R1CI79_9ACTN|nr:PAS domain-containing sensor histidine kinase [Nocardioides jejuensis]TCJ31173.1 ATPase [Nocardioides jejuensis]
MPTLDEIARAHTDLDTDELAWLHLLIADWQIVADLSFADLVLWLPDREGRGFWAGAQQRPTTGPTALLDDVAGTFVPTGRRKLLDTAYETGRLTREGGDPEWVYDVPVRVETIPVRQGDRVLAVIARNTNLLGVRTPSHLELTYTQTASELTRMITRGAFPVPGQRSDHADTPRVGDGFIRLDTGGRVSYASPNALSVYRRLGHAGDLVGQQLAELTRSLVPPRDRPDEETLSAVLGGLVARDTEVASEGVALILRSLPLKPEGVAVGGVILVRDVTDLRRRDRELVTKDATIREIHHRVKNNLQTVAALLRLQARRMGNDDARLALEEAVRRVGSIALVHETLSHTDEEHVAFDEIADRLGRMVADVGGIGHAVAVRREGSFGVLNSDIATPLAMVLTELLQNAVEHGYRQLAVPETDRVGRIGIQARRLVGRLHVIVEDDGVGLPEGFDPDQSTSLGLSIVRTLVESELDGQLTMGAAHATATGTRVEIDVPVAQRLG